MPELLDLVPIAAGGFDAKLPDGCLPTSRADVLHGLPDFCNHPGI